MNTECNINQFHFQGLGTKNIIADFNGGIITSDVEALLLREIDSANNFIENFASCFTDYQNQGCSRQSISDQNMIFLSDSINC